MSWLLQLPKDVFKSHVLKLCIEPPESGPTLVWISRLSQTCRRLRDVCQKIIEENTCTFHIFQKSCEPPDIVDFCRNETYHAHPIGNYQWFICVKQMEPVLKYVDEDSFTHYKGSDRIWENSTIIVGKAGQTIIHYDSLVVSKCFTIHYRANFGEILILTWYDNGHHHHHVHMIWTPGDVWMALIVLDYWPEIHYRYEVCIDHGGPIVRKETHYRVSNRTVYEEDILHDLWNFPTLPRANNK